MGSLSYSNDANDDSFALSDAEQVVCLLKKINKNQERLVDLQVGISEVLKEIKNELYEM